MAKRIRIKINGSECTAVLNESKSAVQFLEKLPTRISMTRWGDEFYGDCGISVETAGDARTEMDVGELALWPQGNALCIFFGPTPASVGNEPRAVSPVNPIGKIEGNTRFLKKLPTVVKAEIDVI
jgi:hypothetical protein